MKLIAAAGSLRVRSLNRRLLLAAGNSAPPGAVLTLFDDLADVPLFNEDLEAEQPAGAGSVAHLRQLIAEADGLLLATPEYNQSIPGVMKNLVDWLSRPDDAGVLMEKPAAIIGATTGPWGTRYAQKELRHALTAAGAVVMPQPMFFLPRAEAALDDAGRLVDPKVARRLTAFLGSFERWIQLVSAPTRVAAEA